MLFTKLLIASVLAAAGGAIMALRALPALLAARATGVIIRRGYKPVRIDRPSSRSGLRSC